MDEISIPVAFGFGIISFATPCVLPLVPVYLANLAGVSVLAKEAKRWVIFLHSLCFVLGFSVIFIAVGASAGLIGRALPSDVLTVIGGAILLIFGIFLLAAIKIPWLNYEKRLAGRFTGRVGYLRSSLMGAAFSLGWTPCVGPILGGILTLAATSQTAWQGVYLLAAYSLGLGIPFLAIGLAFGSLRPVIDWLRKRSMIISIVSGILLIGVGIWLLVSGAAGGILPVGAEVGDQAPDFELQTVHGDTVKLGELRGQPVLLTFWTTHCSACIYQMPFIQEASDERGQEVEFIAIDIGESSYTVKQFVDYTGFDFTFALDSDGKVANDYNIRYTPTNFILDEQGVISDIKIGAYTSAEELIDALDDL